MQTKRNKRNKLPLHSNDANLFVDIIFTIPVQTQIRMLEEFTFPQQPL